jgi:hypothetical protein
MDILDLMWSSVVSVGLIVIIHEWFRSDFKCFVWYVPWNTCKIKQSGCQSIMAIASDQETWDQLYIKCVVGVVGFFIIIIIIVVIISHLWKDT